MKRPRRDLLPGGAGLWVILAMIAIVFTARWFGCAAASRRASNVVQRASDLGPSVQAEAKKYQREIMRDQEKQERQP